MVKLPVSFQYGGEDKLQISDFKLEVDVQTILQMVQ